MAKQTFLLQILSLKGLIFEDQVESVYLKGGEGEFELLPNHFPLMAFLPEGDIMIANYDPILIKLGVIMFKDNVCTIIAEAHPSCPTMKQGWDVIVA